MFRRWGGEIVLVARFFAGLRQFNGLVAGMAGMPWWRFLAHNSAGAALWVTFWGVGFYVFGQHLSCLMPRLGHVLPIVGAAALLLVLIGIFLCRRWAKCTTAEDYSHQWRPARPARARGGNRGSTSGGHALRTA